MLKSLTLASVILAIAAGSAPASPFKAPAAPSEALVVPADHVILYGEELYVGPRVRRGYAPRYLYREAPPRIYVPAEPYGRGAGLSPREVRSALRQQGFTNIEGVRRAGRFYRARGRDGRSNLVSLTVSAADGRVVRTRVVERAVKAKPRQVARAARAEKAPRRVARAAPRAEEEATAGPRPYQPPKKDVASRSPGLPEAKPAAPVVETYVAARAEAGIPREEPEAETDPAGDAAVETEVAAASAAPSDEELPSRESRIETPAAEAESLPEEPRGEGDSSEAGDDQPIADAADAASEPIETAALPQAPEPPFVKPEAPEAEAAAVAPAPQETAALQVTPAAPEAVTPPPALQDGEPFVDTELTPDEPESEGDSSASSQNEQPTDAASDAASTEAEAPIVTAALLPPKLPRVKPKIVPAAVRRVGPELVNGAGPRLQRAPGPEATDARPAQPIQPSIALEPPTPAKAPEETVAAQAPREAVVEARPRTTDAADVPVRNPLVVYE